jgi:hypothetical protein
LTYSASPLVTILIQIEQKDPRQMKEVWRCFMTPPSNTHFTDEEMELRKEVGSP